MQITSSTITLTAAQSRTQTTEEQSRLSMWDDRAKQQGHRIPARQPMEHAAAQTQVRAEAVDDAAAAVTADPKLLAMIRALEALTGRRIRIETFRAQMQSHDVTPEAGKGAQEAPQREGWGIDFAYEKRTSRTQSLDFSAEGRVTLADSTKIDLSAAFSMRSVQVEREGFRFKAGDALIDPLVVNFDGGMLELGSVRHRFDLDLDGKTDEIAFAGSGSGFLALDRNADGTINDGSELFGPTEGDGFAELAAHDGDGNGWIDEADAVFEKLLIWTKEADGTETLYSLKEKGVGAIYLENIATPFDYANGLDGYDGKLRASSLFLGENGSVGTVQEVDLKI
jgi:hypothetical protein